MVVWFAHVRVGHRQALNTLTPASSMLGFFIAWNFLCVLLRLRIHRLWQPDFEHPAAQAPAIVQMDAATTLAFTVQARNR